MLCLIMGSLALHAQYEWHNYFQGDLLAQSRKLNPAFFQKKQKHVISLSGFYFGLDQEGPSYWDFLRSEGKELINLDDALLAAENQNYIRGDISLNTISYTRNFDHNYLSFGHSVKFNSLINFPYELLDLVANGNYKFIDKTIEIGPEIQLRTYHEFNVGYGHRFTNLSIGGNLKLISGIQDISTPSHKISLYTDPEFYQFHLETDFQLNSSSIIRTDSLGNTTVKFKGFGLNSFSLMNPGIAMDFGVNYSSGPFIIAASAINIGRIRWNFNPEQRISKGSYIFDGFEVSDFLGDSIAIFDSLSTIAGIEKNTASYRTNFPVQLYASIGYRLEDWSFGLLFSQDYIKNTRFSAAVLNVRRTINEKHSLALQYGIRRGQFLNIGFQGVVRIGPFQFYGGTDNIFGMVKAFDSNFSNIRIGVNLILDQEKSE